MKQHIDAFLAACVTAFCTLAFVLGFSIAAFFAAAGIATYAIVYVTRLFAIPITVIVCGPVAVSLYAVFTTGMVPAWAGVSFGIMIGWLLICWAWTTIRRPDLWRDAWCCT